MAISTITSASTTGVITSGTAVASTSGTSINFTGIPSWAKRITVMFNEVSTNGTSNLLVQIGSGSVDTSSYVSWGMWTYNAGTIVGTTSTAGFLTTATNAAAYLTSGMLTMTLVGSNIWVYNSNVEGGVVSISLCSGKKTLSGALDRVRITTVNGTDTFDAGSINILYE